jgi:hypothetical protein
LGIATGIDILLDLVQDKKKITLKKAAKDLKITEDKVEKWGRIMSDESLLELNYPANPLEPPFLQMIGYSEKNKKKSKKEKKKNEKPKKEKEKLRRRRRIKPKAFFRRFKSTSKKRREYKPYKEKKIELKKKAKEKPKRADKLVGNQIKLLAVVITFIFFLMIYFGVFDNIISIFR